MPSLKQQGERVRLYVNGQASLSWRRTLMSSAPSLHGIILPGNRSMQWQCALLSRMDILSHARPSLQVLGYTRSKANQENNTSLLRIEGVNTKKEAEFYFGKRIAYIYKARKQRQGSYFRAIWGRVTRAHGSTGAVRAKFTSNLPAISLGGKVRVMLYPSRV